MIEKSAENEKTKMKRGRERFKKRILRLFKQKES